MKQKLLALALLTVGAVFGGISLGINIGAPPPPRVVRVRPASPGAGYVFVEGYWYPVNGHYRWQTGYWSRPPYEGALWVGPHHDGKQFFNGYWEGQGHERVEHDHASDKDRNRDYREEHH